MAILTRMINKEIERQRQQIINSFKSRNATSMDKGIKINDIYGSSNRNLQGLISDMMKKGFVKYANGVYWFNEATYQQSKSKDKRALIILAAFAVVAIVAFLLINN